MGMGEEQGCRGMGQLSVGTWMQDSVPFLSQVA